MIPLVNTSTACALMIDQPGRPRLYCPRANHSNDPYFVVAADHGSYWLEIYENCQNLDSVYVRPLDPEATVAAVPRDAKMVTAHSLWFLEATMRDALDGIRKMFREMI